MADFWEQLLILGSAAVLGGMIGVERELHGRVVELLPRGAFDRNDFAANHYRVGSGPVTQNPVLRDVRRHGKEQPHCEEDQVSDSNDPKGHAGGVGHENRFWLLALRFWLCRGVLPLTG